MAKSIKKQSTTIPVSDVGESHSLYIKGRIVNISPMKKAKNNDNQYFERQISDRKCSLRFVGFDTKKRDVMEDYLEKEKPVNIANCSA